MLSCLLSAGGKIMYRIYIVVSCLVVLIPLYCWLTGKLVDLQYPDERCTEC